MEYNKSDKCLLLLAVQPSSAKAKWKEIDSVDDVQELFNDTSKADEIIERLEKLNVIFLSYLNESFPQSLLDIDEPPIGLFCKGDISLLSEGKRIAIVGRRRITQYGKDVTRDFTRAITNSGNIVVSGLATGVDTLAHSSCLGNGGKTIAVVAGGLDSVYPSQNKYLFESIAQEGLIISEYALGVRAQGYQFPARNRIISGISQAVLVTEASKKSGSLITARYAIEQGKDLYVVPGNIYSEASEGCNELIKNGACYVALEPCDIVGKREEYVDYDKLKKDLDKEQIRVLDLLENGEMHVAEIMEGSGLQIEQLSALLTTLEMFDLIRATGGNYYELVPHLKNKGEK